MVQRVGLDKRVPEQVQVLQTQLEEVCGQNRQLIVRSGEEPQLREPADSEGQAGELIVVQLEVDQFSELAEASWQGAQPVLAEVQHLEGLLQRG